MADGVEIQFVGVPSKEFDCPICLETLKNPFTIECCRHHFCNACIDNVKLRKNECPLCKAQPIKGTLNKRFKQAIDEAQVYCSLRSAGCKWMGRFDALNDHLSLTQQYGQCEHVMLNCPHKKCEARMPRHQMMEHVKNCEYRPFACLHCGHKGTYTEVVTKHYKCCSQYPVVCLNCTTQKIFKRKELPKHLDVCPNAMVSCPFASLGCHPKHKRCDLKKHNSSNITQHSLLVNSAVRDLKEENNSQKENLKEKISALEEKYSQLEKDFFSSLHMHEQSKVLKDKLITDLCEKNAVLESKLSSLYDEHVELKSSLSATCLKLENSVFTRCAALEDQFHKFENHVMKPVAVNKSEQHDESLQKNSSMVPKPSKHVTNSLYCSNVRSDDSTIADKKDSVDLRSIVNMLEAKYVSLEEKLRSYPPIPNQERITGTLQQSETKAAMLQGPFSVEHHQNINYWIHGFKLMAEHMKRCNWRLYLKTMAETATQFPDAVSPVIMKFEGYEMAKAFRMTMVSAPFYTSGLGKYKLHLIVHVNDFVAVANSISFMSVNTSFLKGEYDDVLPWPFVGNISVSLLNQIENKHHYQRALWLPHDRPTVEYAGRVPPNQHSNWPWGQRTFISQQELESATPFRQYITNDSLYVEVQATAMPPYNYTHYNN